MVKFFISLVFSLLFFKTYSQDYVLDDYLISEIEYYLGKDKIEEYKNFEKAIVLVRTMQDDGKESYCISSIMEYYRPRKFNFLIEYKGVYVFISLLDFDEIFLSDDFYEKLAKKHFSKDVEYRNLYGMYPMETLYDPRRICISVKNDVVIDREEYSRE
jgi:hypothetical protein